jgi:divinyl protochlorophyllide a 8-vinyl-reductase
MTLLSAPVQRSARRTAHADGRIGPNAILQPYAELVATVGRAKADAMLHASTGRSPDAMPERMVDEQEANAFARAILGELGPLGQVVLHRAGHRTARYLLANRIPKPAQVVIRLLPARAGLSVLLGAVGRHSWTFAGSGDFAYGLDPTPWVSVIRCPMCRGVHAKGPTCHFYAGTFEGLLQALIHRRAQVVETHCEAMGEDRCRFGLEVPARRDYAPAGAAPLMRFSTIGASRSAT